MNLVNLSILFVCTGLASLILAFVCGVNASTYRAIRETAEADRAVWLGRWTAWIGLALGSVGCVLFVLWALGVGR